MGALFKELAMVWPIR